MRERERAWRKAVKETRGGEEEGGEREGGRMWGGDAKKGRRFFKKPTCWLGWSTFKDASDVRLCLSFGKSRTNHQTGGEVWGEGAWHVDP